MESCGANPGVNAEVVTSPALCSSKEVASLERECDRSAQREELELAEKLALAAAGPAVYVKEQ